MSAVKEIWILKISLMRIIDFLNQHLVDKNRTLFFCSHYLFFEVHFLDFTILFEVYPHLIFNSLNNSKTQSSVIMNKLSFLFICFLLWLKLAILLYWDSSLVVCTTLAMAMRVDMKVMFLCSYSIQMVWLFKLNTPCKTGQPHLHVVRGVKKYLFCASSLEIY